MKRYSLNLVVIDEEDKAHVVYIQVKNRSMETVQQLIRVAMSDLTKVPIEPLKKQYGNSQKITPPIEPMFPTKKDIKRLQNER